jgi:hypothetical protein
MRIQYFIIKRTRFINNQGECFTAKHGNDVHNVMLSAYAQLLPLTDNEDCSAVTCVGLLTAVTVIVIIHANDTVSCFSVSMGA